MNRLSSSLFGQLFYLRAGGLFATRGLPYAIENKVYHETFTVGPLRQSTFDFLYDHKPELQHFMFRSMIELDSTYRELYLFQASHWGVHEQHHLCTLKDGFVEKVLDFEDVYPLVEVLKRSSHVVQDSSCY
jgi:hypothetical protein